MKKKKLSDLILEISKIKDLKRIRYTTSHPKDFTDDLVDVHKNCEKLMPLIHLPVQSGSNKILQEMNRKHSINEYLSVIQKIKKAKPNTKVTTPSTAAIKALRKMKIKKISVFTPYPKKLNNEVIDFLKKEKFIITSNSYFDIKSDIDIGKVDPEYLFKVLSKMDHKNADALFVSCTALPVLSILNRLEKKIKKIVISSNQALIWDTLEKIGKNNSITNFGKLFKAN